MGTETGVKEPQLICFMMAAVSSWAVAESANARLHNANTSTIFMAASLRNKNPLSF